MADHEHDVDALGPDESEFAPGDDLRWRLDNVILCSVGVDVGSSGSQVVFSRLHLRRRSEALTSRFVVVDREALYRSPVSFTPFAADGLIDAVALGTILDEAYGSAGIRPSDVDTGVVILTGEALRRRNAAAIATIVAERAGDFVCVAAGHHMEARLAAYGSGAAAVSTGLGRPLINVDIGGGTTKLALVQDGRVVRTAALHLGGRLVAVDDEQRIVRLELAGTAYAARAGFDWVPGAHAGPKDRAAVAESMADTLVEALTAGTDAPSVADLLLTEPLGPVPTLAGLQFSGGVGEYVYRREDRDFGDLGRALGLAIRTRIDDGRLPYPLLAPGERIRATVLGASAYSVQLSGSTSFLSDPATLLPRRNLRAVRPHYALGDVVDSAAVGAAVRDCLATADLDIDADVLLALTWSGIPEYGRLAAFASGVADGLRDRLAADRPLYLALDGDIAQSLGTLLRTEFGAAAELVVLDGLELWDFDFIDLSRLQLPSRTVVVTIKSLIFDDGRARREPHAD